MSVLSDSIWLVIVAALWGFTNPLMKSGGKGIDNITSNSKVLRILNELKFLLFNWKYMLPFIVNQSGSVLFYLTLASAGTSAAIHEALLNLTHPMSYISIAVPVTNSLTFMFTAIASRLLGENVSGLKTYAGVLLVAAGVTLCVFSKHH